VHRKIHYVQNYELHQHSSK